MKLNKKHKLVFLYWLETDAVEKVSHFIFMKTPQSASLCPHVSPGCMLNTRCRTRTTHPKGAKILVVKGKNTYGTKLETFWSNQSGFALRRSSPRCGQIGDEQQEVGKCGSNMKTSWTVVDGRPHVETTCSLLMCLICWGSGGRGWWRNLDVSGTGRPRRDGVTASGAAPMIRLTAPTN